MSWVFGTHYISAKNKHGRESCYASCQRFGSHSGLRYSKPRLCFATDSAHRRFLGPFFLFFSLHCGCVGVLHLEPIGRAAGTKGRSPAASTRYPRRVLWRTVSPNASLGASCRRLGFDIAFLCYTLGKLGPALTQEGLGHVVVADPANGFGRACGLPETAAEGLALHQRARLKETASCLNRSAGTRRRWVRMTLRGGTSRAAGRPSSCATLGAVVPTHRAAASVTAARSVCRLQTRLMRGGVWPECSTLDRSSVALAGHG
jgi:hypothetical protein